MPYYNDLSFFKDSDDSVFTTLYNVSTLAPVSGIYRCTLCGHEMVIDEGRELPPDGDHGCTHETRVNLAKAGRFGQPRKFQWQLVAAPKHRHSSPTNII